MLARRIIAVSPDKAFGKQLVTALKAAGGAVDLHPSIDALGKGEIQAALVVLHLDGEMATAAAEVLPRLAGDSRVICVLPRTNLPAVVDVMQSSDRISGIMVAEEFDSRQLSAMATRVLAGDIFGLEKLISWGTQIHSQLVGDYQEKSLCISQISEFAELMGVRRKYREAVEQCIDEMLMNALYDAPVDEAGKQIFSEIPTKTRISLRLEQKAVVQYACDGHRFVVSVRDAFGTLERSTVLRYLHKCLHAAPDQQIDRKAGGAGLGLYLMVNSATTVYFNVLPGVATEASCVFDLETPKLQLKEFGFFTEKIDAGGRLAAGTSRRLPQGHPVERRRTPQAPPAPRGIVAALAVAITAMLVLIGVAAWPRIFPSTKTTQVTFTTIPKGATIEVEGRNAGTANDGTIVVRGLEVGRAYPVVAKLDGYETKQMVVQPSAGPNAFTFELVGRTSTVVLDSMPSGASVEINGRPVGMTPVTLTDLAPNTDVEILLKRTGYESTTTKLGVPGPGKELRMVQPLSIAAQFARVKLVSEPVGAQVVQNGQLLAGVTTPAELIVEAGKVQRFMLTLPGMVPSTIDPFTPGRGATGIVKSGKLVPGSALTFESTATDGKVTVANAPHCRDLAVPAECTLSPGNYSVDFVATGVKITRQLKVTAKDATERFELGVVEAPDGKHLQVGGQKVKKVTLEVGPRTVTVIDGDATRQVQVKVKAGTSVVAN